MITKLDFVGVPSTDADRSREFYIETLGLKPDPRIGIVRSPAAYGTHGSVPIVAACAGWAATASAAAGRTARARLATDM